MERAMLPGFLHLDCSRGLTAPMLNGAMADLLIHNDRVNKAFETLKLSELTVELANASSSVKGKTVRFYINGHRLEPQGNFKDLKVKNAFINACLQSDAVSLKAISEPFMSKELDAQVSAIALKILENLQSPLFVEQNLSGPDALWLFCHTLMLAVQLRELDPKYVSATPVHLSVKNQSLDISSTLKLKDPLWLRDTLRWVPIIEVSESVHVDVVAVSFLKTVAGNIGARGACTSMTVGVGLAEEDAQHRSGLLEAWWCEARLPNTMNEVGPSNKAKSYALIEVTGIVAIGSDMANLAAMLSLHKAISVNYHMVRLEKNIDVYQVRFLIAYEDKREAVEAFLLKAAASHVSLQAAEYHELNKRIVTIPIGHGNKSTAIRFYEYIYYDKCVRVEPFKDDLDLYVKKTDYSMEVARGDLLMAWKKWRGRLVEESS